MIAAAATESLTLKPTDSAVDRRPWPIFTAVAESMMLSDATTGNMASPSARRSDGGRS